MVKLFCGALLTTIFSVAAFAQDIGIPFIKNFSPEDYNAEPQNWQITQDKDGIILVANNSGLLEFDGVNWTLINLPKKIARSVDVSKDGRVYVGAIGDLGYLSPNRIGEREFVSLLKKIPDEYHDFVDVWRTSATTEGVYFKTNRYIFFWDGMKMTIWNAPKFFAFSFIIGDDFYVKEDSLGLIRFRNKQLYRLPSGEFFREKEIRSIVDAADQSLLISTLEHGMFRYFPDGKIKPLRTAVDDFLKKNLLFASTRINKMQIAFGTFRGGLAIMDNQGSVKKILTEESGIRDNSIRAMFLDREGGLWLGLNNGISRIEVNSPVTILDKRTNIKGSVYQINRHEATLYVGTSVGLNYIEAKTGQVRPIENFADQAWSLFTFENQQLLGTNASTFSLQDFRLQLINNSGGSFTFLRSTKDNNRVFVGLRDGLESLYKSSTGWRIENQYKKIKGQVKTILEESNGNIWVLSNQQGVARLRFLSGYNSPAVDFFGYENGVPNDDRYKLLSVNSAVSIFSNLKFYRYDSAQKKFTDSGIHISGDLDAAKELSNLSIDRNGSFLGWSNSSVGYLEKKDPVNYYWRKTPFDKIRDKAINTVYADGDSLIWVGSANGLYRIDIRENKIPFEGFKTQLRRVSQINTDSTVFGGNDKGDNIKLNYSFNQLRFQYASPFYDQPEETEYQTFLEGSDEVWSNWNTNTKKDYTNLWEGSYTFRVKSRNVYHAQGQEAQFSFTILPPWYRTKAAYVFYFIGIAAFFYGSVRTYYNNLKRTNKQLESLVEKRTARINAQKEEIESQRDNLAQARNTIEKQNDELLRMNHELEKIVDERTSALTRSNIELLEVNKELDRFVYRAAHDLRGPVATLLGLCNLSLKETHDQAAIGYLSQIQLTAERMNFLLFMLLKINRIKTTDVNSEPVDIGSLVKNILSSLLANYRHQSEFNVSVSIDPQLQVHSDKALLTVILENLIDNSLKFARPDVIPQIDIEVKKSNDRMHILITDNGIGIHEDYKSKIFDMFFIGTAERKGLGLGLHAVQLAVKKLKGTIRLVESNLVSTQFEVDIPERV